MSNVRTAALGAAIVLAASLGQVVATPLPVAVSGGLIVADVLSPSASSKRFSAQQVALARDVRASTVGLALFDAQGRSEGLCSASIVHERVVLTAAHCVMIGREVRERITVVFEDGSGAVARREGIDVAVHPSFLKLVRSSANRIATRDLPRFLRSNGNFFGADLALILLHRPVPGTHRATELVAPGFRDGSHLLKVIAGYGLDSGYATGEPALRFAEIQGANLRSDQGEITGGDEIVLESKYRGGTRVSTCKGDSGGPIFVQDRSSGRLQQVGVSSAGDERCREVAISASINGQREVLRQMFRYLTDGESAGNPF